MSELNREQIIKALECCTSEVTIEFNCTACPYIGKGCNSVVMRDALSLIKELTEENERLRAEVSVKKKLLDKCVDLEDKVKACTVKKMQEMVYEFADDLNTIDAYIIKEMIDQIAKVLIGE
jgi:hypothetical protein